MQEASGTCSLWLPRSSVTRPPLISPGVKPPIEASSIEVHLPAATCANTPPGIWANRLHLQAYPVDPGSSVREGMIVKEVKFLGGSLQVCMRPQAWHVSGFLLISLSELGAEVSSSGKYGLSNSREEWITRNGTNKYCLLAMEVHLKAVLHGPSGQMHVPLKCPLAHIPAGNKLPERVPLSLIQLRGQPAIQTLCLGQPGEQCGLVPPAQYITQDRGPDDLLDDVWLEACPAKDPQHTAFKLSRSPGLSLVMALHGGMRARSQQLTEIGSRKQMYAHRFQTNSSDAPIQMSALLPQPLAQGSTINILIEAHLTIGALVPKKHWHRMEGCTAGGLHPSAPPGCWVQSLHCMPITSAWATLPVNDAQ